VCSQWKGGHIDITIHIGNDALGTPTRRWAQYAAYSWRRNGAERTWSHEAARLPVLTGRD
jgi:hypothetical protein